ncbi:20337_t:CDS:2, partial [Racocetra persica]
PLKIRAENQGLLFSENQEKQHLVHKAHEHPWCRIIICTEEYTSKTCGFCSYIYHKLGGSKVFRCPKYKTELDRDINSARNILLRYLTKN